MNKSLTCWEVLKINFKKISSQAGLDILIDVKPIPGRFREHNRIMRYHKKLPSETHQCEYCNKDFKHWASLVRFGKLGRFCSRECFLAASRVTVVCDHCGTSFERQKKTAGRYSGKNFCNRVCNYASRRKDPNKIAIKRLRYGNSEFLKKRKQVIERDGVCQICSNALANSVHHINWNPYDNDLTNLLLLCKKCHGHFKQFETVESCRNRIVGCSDPYSDVGKTTEMIVSDN